MVAHLYFDHLDVCFKKIHLVQLFLENGNVEKGWALQFH